VEEYKYSVDGEEEENARGGRKPGCVVGGWRVSGLCSGIQTSAQGTARHRAGTGRATRYARLRSGMDVLRKLRIRSTTESEPLNPPRQDALGAWEQAINDAAVGEIGELGGREKVVHVLSGGGAEEFKLERSRKTGVGC
jgi:hypothetical protein